MVRVRVSVRVRVGARARARARAKVGASPLPKQVPVGGSVPDGRINHTMSALGTALYVYGGAYKSVRRGSLRP